MKIHSFGVSRVNPYNLQANKMDNQKLSHKKAFDKLEISSEAKVMQEGSNIQAERQAKIEQLKRQVENGTYTLDSKATAKGIIDYFKR
ncbi:flagellar biosynthesis anti-sigma factor FlgM [Peribacillus asahii]|uniref:flagellar biosynthesis anti-sigma factor FlgM n=1 Tax=Peribacillus asahii TaxID=228899 RepID=UPI00207A65B6|nr:flagellar biosynthesis anti-sigma factor FlgM [Peribacillus asahii]USK69980.1 flagellar biosynthesis anti-sigma factor FlgM [Peribacillus asahii]